MSKPNLNALQQMCHLREFFIVHHMREKETANAGCKIVSPITIPRFLVQDLVLDMSNDPSKTYDELKQMHPRESWKNLEKVIIERIHGQEVMFLSKTCQSIFSPVSNNNLVPQVILFLPLLVYQALSKKKPVTPTICNRLSL